MRKERVTSLLWPKGTSSVPGCPVAGVGALGFAISGGEVPARHPGDGKLKPLEDAPGSYVRILRQDARRGLVMAAPQAQQTHSGERHSEQ
jgi:hypothetical protein